MERVLRQRNAGPSMRFDGVPKDWRQRRRTGPYKRNATEMGMRLKDLQWRTGRRMKMANQIDSQGNVARGCQVESASMYLWLTQNNGNGLQWEAALGHRKEESWV